MAFYSSFNDVIEDKTREQLIYDLKDSNQLLTNVIEFYPDATLIIDSGGKVIAWNKAMEELTGTIAADMIGKGDYEYALPFYGQRKPLLLNMVDMSPSDINDRYKDVRVHNGRLEALAIKARLNGREAVLWATASKLYSTEGKVVGAIESIRDVTEQNKAEDLRRESEQRLADIIDFLPDATFAIDKDGKVVSWNKAIEEMTGVKAEDMLGKDDHAYALPFYGVRRPILIDLAFGSDVEMDKKYSYIKKEGDVSLAEIDLPMKGEMRALWVKAVPLHDSKGNIVGAIESIRDITDKKQAVEELRRHKDHLEELVAERTADLREVNESLLNEILERERVEKALIKSEKFLQNVFECIQDGISILDKDLNIIHVNHTMDEWYSNMVPIAGKKCYYAYHNRSEPCENCPSLIAIKDKTRHFGIVPYTMPDGVTGWMELYCFPLINDDGNVIGVIEQVRNITDRMKAENELIDAKAQAELYLDLMGHDINNLNQIGLGFLELALDTLSLDEKNRSMLSRPLAALESSSRLIDNVRKLQKVKSGELYSQEIDVGQVLSNVQAYYSHIPGGNVTIDYKPASDCIVMADELLYEVFSNIVGNAIKHSTRTPMIKIELEKEFENGKEYYKVIIDDNGPGISDDLKHRIFTRHLKGSTKAKGSGIGLYLVKALVDSYEGRVWVEDRIAGNRSEGSRFVVMLPAHVRS